MGYAAVCVQQKDDGKFIVDFKDHRQPQSKWTENHAQIEIVWVE